MELYVARPTGHGGSVSLVDNSAHVHGDSRPDEASGSGSGVCRRRMLIASGAAAMACMGAPSLPAMASKAVRKAMPWVLSCCCHAAASHIGCLCKSLSTSHKMNALGSL